MNFKTVVDGKGLIKDLSRWMKYKTGEPYLGCRMQSITMATAQCQWTVFCCFFIALADSSTQWFTCLVQPAWYLLYQPMWCVHPKHYKRRAWVGLALWSLWLSKTVWGGTEGEHGLEVYKEFISHVVFIADKHCIVLVQSLLQQCLLLFDSSVCICK